MGREGERAVIHPWQKTGSKPAGDYRIFTIRSDTRLSPRTQKPHDFFVIDCVNWVNVVAITPRREIVMIEQFRHGSETIELEVPGGMIDAKDTSPEAAGARELREETGYEGFPAMIIGQVFPNPAIMSNTCYTALIENCECRHPVEFDHSEDIVTRLVPAEQIPGLIAEGKIRHSLVVVALYAFELWERRKKE
jgi:8-oxo-dGTP pyrophosphatase MutT (NUDIX family)